MLGVGSFISGFCLIVQEAYFFRRIRHELASTHASPMIGATINPSHLLSQLTDILDSDPCIDEVGFIHPSQFASLNKEVHIPSSMSSEALSQPGDEISESKPAGASSSNTFFWHSEHKLGISTLVLVPLYNAAKDAFMNALKRYRMLSDSNVQKDKLIDNNTSVCPASFLDIVESELMKRSKALVILSCDFGTAWNFRKLLVSKKQLLQMYMDELLLSTLVLSYSPKSERAWNHRRWVIKMIAEKCPNLQEIVETESELNSKMNYRAWNHRCWLISYMLDSQVLREWQNSRDWAGLHVADNSCFHYRARLLLRMTENLRNNHASDAFSRAKFHQMWKDELNWVAVLIKRYVGREALWLHRRFLSVLRMKYFAIDDECLSCDMNMFITEELKLFHSCTIIPDNDFGDFQAQATYSATYIMWLAKQMPESFGVELQICSRNEELKSLLDKVGKSCLWDCFTAT
ncbi:hypothetical protein ACJIZ3_012576 [Penstemon smallii]|uniref:Protein prenyltransferase alpha subunit repeat-containing protein 1 n=1 Tax=Penstemon smallii TaxID=265156 RepID=A0ABD3UMF4_9LAMI